MIELATLMVKKRSLGQYFTKNNVWLLPHIVDFIYSQNFKVAYDPYAGEGDLLEKMKELGFRKIKGLDIDKRLNWEINDSLRKIPKIENSILITNPPYLTNYSARRRGIYDNVKKYFKESKYDDLYLIAIEKCLVNDFGIMIVPETFLNSNFPKNRLHSITIVEENLFKDTETPICIICFDNQIKNYDKIKVYKNNRYLNNLDFFEKNKLKPAKNIPIKFNVRNGNIALRAVDSVGAENPISFMEVNKLKYDLNKIKISSRLLTIVDIPLKNNELNKVIQTANILLNKYRQKTEDVNLSPFKGNRKDGSRRRRLDYKTARAILEQAYLNETDKKLI